MGQRAHALTMPEEPEADPIERVRGLSGGRFHRDYFRPKRPVVLDGFALDWPAVRTWSLPYLATLEPKTTVYVEKGNVIQGDADFAVVNFQNYVQRLLDKDDEIHDPSRPKRPYATLIDILRVFPELTADLRMGFFTDLTMLNATYGWVGPAGTVTGYHTDWSDNILIQVAGRKRVLLVPPERTNCMYPTRRYEFRSDMSAIDVKAWDPVRHPRYAEARPATVVLNPGDILYVPPKWWHRVESLDISISINNFGQDWRGLLRNEAPARMMETLHNWGFYGKDCTCHMMVEGKRVAKATQLVGSNWK